jgi:SAM-dependent methyltransferase
MSCLELLHGRYVHNRRISVLSEWCSSLIPRNASVLDVGSGDGRLVRVVSERRSDVSICALEVRLRTDAVMFVDVLHHTVEPMALLSEAVRVARHLIIIKDHLLQGTLAYSTLRLMDWVGNARHHVALPYNYWTAAEWQRAFSQLKLAVSSWESNLKLYPFPADLIFGRSLHFIAALRLPTEDRDFDVRLRHLDR